MFRVLLSFKGTKTYTMPSSLIKGARMLVKNTKIESSSIPLSKSSKTPDINVLICARPSNWKVMKGKTLANVKKIRPEREKARVRFKASCLCCDKTASQRMHFATCFFPSSTLLWSKSQSWQATNDFIYSLGIFYYSNALNANFPKISRFERLIHYKYLIFWDNLWVTAMRNGWNHNIPWVWEWRCEEYSQCRLMGISFLVKCG